MSSPDTIVATSTPAGRSLRAIVRLSGPRSVEIASGLFRSDPPLGRLATYTSVAGTIEIPPEPIRCPAVAYIMLAPRSYTREDIVELHLPGSPPLLAALVDALIALGARPAEPGEFTRRAFLNGRIDLTQAEAVQTIIHARSQSELRIAQSQLAGSFRTAIDALRAELLLLTAQVEAAIDFVDQDIDLIDPADVAGRIEAIAASIGELACAPAPAPPKDGVATVICGLPNAGKSSLLNALAGHARAIVTPIPGTTRDTIEHRIETGGVTFRLIDTAGLRDLPAGAPADSDRTYRSYVPYRSHASAPPPATPPCVHAPMPPCLHAPMPPCTHAPVRPRPHASSPPDQIEQEAIARAHRALDRADLILLVIDAARPLGPEAESFWNHLTSHHHDTTRPNAEPKTRDQAPTCGTGVPPVFESGSDHGQDGRATPSPDALPRPPVITLLNKSDLPRRLAASDAARIAQRGPTVELSALRGDGLDSLRAAMAAAVRSPSIDRSAHPFWVETRHRAALLRAEHSLRIAHAALAASFGLEFAAADLHDALTALADLLGAATPDDILDAIFARFCIGK